MNGECKRIEELFHAQKAHQYTIKGHASHQRIEKLRKLRSCIKDYTEDIIEAIGRDFRKPGFETALTEINFVLKEIDFFTSNLADWTKGDEQVTLLSEHQTARGRIVYEPRGVCLIIAPWNFPFQLQILPLIAAIAAGNCCILKPSELTPATGNMISDIILETFDVKEIAVVRGGAETGSFLLTLPFDHIFYTGGSEVGKIVMEAAAKHLSSVTLELGGKSPVIIDRHANIEQAAMDIAWGKGLNAGQICLAPDYILVPTHLRDQFVHHLQKAFQSMYYTNNGKLNKEDLASIINQKHFQRLKRLLDDAVEKGAHIVFGGIFEPDDLMIHPTIINDVPEHSLLMQEEIFGPLLPIITYDTLIAAVQYIRKHDKPLALYLYSQDNANIEYLIRHTTSGGVCVNGVIAQVTDPHLPFGGVNASGTGSYHGIYGFKAFSHERSVYYQSSDEAAQLLYPPHANKTEIIRYMLE
jgi:aldehyde dehydrogenase (NAD+)